MLEAVAEVSTGADVATGADVSTAAAELVASELETGTAAAVELVTAELTMAELAAGVELPEPEDPSQVKRAGPGTVYSDAL